MQKRVKRTITSPIILPSRLNEKDNPLPLLSGIMLPKWGGDLSFRYAREREAKHLKRLYESAWNNDLTSELPITITESQICQMIRNFPEGQIVGSEKRIFTRIREAFDFIGLYGIRAALHRAKEYFKETSFQKIVKDAALFLWFKKPVSMVNIMLGIFNPEKGFSGGYEKLTGGRTFSTSKGVEELRQETKDGKALPVAYCVSIAVMPEHSGGGYAKETLNYAIMFSLANHFVAAPYSAPRRFRKARDKNPHLGIMDYLHMTAPQDISYEEFLVKSVVLMPKLTKLYGGRIEHSRGVFDKYQAMERDPIKAKPEETAYMQFLNDEGKNLSRKYGRQMTIEDFCIISGRALVDPVIGMHVSNGARFIRNSKGEIIAVFSESRPEDLAAFGYNIVLSYTYNPMLGHEFASRKYEE